MTKLILADLNQGFISASGQIDKARLSEQLTALAKQDTKLGFMTAAPYAKMLQLFRGVKQPLTFICEGGAETVVERVVRDETVIDYDIWREALTWLQSQRDFNTAYVVLSGKMNAYTDATPDSSAYQKFSELYPSLYKMKDISLVSDLVYQMRLGFASGDLESLAQTFNSNFNGKLVAHATAQDIWITAFEATYENAISGLSGELELAENDVSVINRTNEVEPLAAIFDDAPKNGYDAIDQLIQK